MEQNEVDHMIQETDWHRVKATDRKTADVLRTNLPATRYYRIDVKCVIAKQAVAR
jgi:hypothetical protein